MSEAAPHSEQETHKRRSTRIAQAVPLTVTGVDALGRPFQERTSTLSINCHGCRYQSKHYVLKNMWVTIEVPNPESGREPRVGRGRVTWIQRPRTVRELFQVGIDLEIPGNIWGIAFPPADWFPSPETQAAVPMDDVQGAAAEQTLPAADWQAPAAEPQQADNVVVIGSAAAGTGAGADVSLHLARQMARMVVEAKQQIQAAVREAASKSVAQEFKQFAGSIESQLNEAAKKAVHAAAEAHSKHWVESAAERIEMQARASSEAMREQWTREVDARLEESRALIAARVASLEQAEEESFRAALGVSVDSAIDRLRQASEAATARTEQVRDQFERSRQQLRAMVEEATRRWEEVLSSRTTDATTHVEQLREAAEELSGRIQRAIQEGEGSWRSQMEADAADATKQAAAAASDALEQALREASARLTRQSQTEMERLQEQAESQMVVLRRQAEFLHTQATQALAEFRTQWLTEAERSQTAFAHVQETVQHVSEIARQVDTVQHQTIAQLQERANELLEATTRDLHSRADAAVSELPAKLQPVLEAAGAQTAEQFRRQIESGMAPLMDRAAELIEKLSVSQANADELLRMHEERLARTAEDQVQQAAQRLTENSARVEKEWQDSIHSSMTKWIEDLDSRATDLTHTTIESLYKSANWYEKKVQTQMQTSLEKGVDQAGEALRARAGELSGLFASELDHYSRSFVDHAQGQLSETTNDAMARAEESIRAAVESGGNEVGARARRAAQVELERFTAALRNSYDQANDQIKANAAHIRNQLGVETRQFLADFQTNLSLRSQESLRSTGKMLDDHAAALAGAARANAAEQERQFAITLSEASDAAMETYKGRMENASNAWLLTSAAKLNQVGEEQVEALARAAEAKLREVFTQVFASVGDSLRERLLGISLPAPQTPPSKS